jgi:FixJ family two-component response regulator
MMEHQPTVFVVDDNPSVRKALARLLRVAGYQVETFPSARAFLDQGETPRPACLVLDVNLPGLNGFDLQEALAAEEDPVPIIFITGHGDIPMSVRAMKAGAMDFLAKPFLAEELLEAVRHALLRDHEARACLQEATELRHRAATLTPREREVFSLVATGLMNKEIASELGAGEKTIKVHRGRVMQKMGAQSLADLVRMADKTGDLKRTPASPC